MEAVTGDAETRFGGTPEATVGPVTGILPTTPTTEPGAYPEPPAQPLAWTGKRVFDIIASLVLLVVLLPLTLLVATCIKLTSRGDVFFRQTRVGFGGRQFRIFKFRTMAADAEGRLASEPELRSLYLAGDHKIPCAHDPRVTRLGRFLRRSSLDELPQLLNVLVGDMSLVGPRPVRPDEMAHYAGREGSYLDLRPGMTGVWQVSGRSRVTFPHRAQLDEYYAGRCSPSLDLRILSRTVISVLRADGAT